jgi:hypothetical protein
MWLGNDEDAKPYYASEPKALLRLVAAVVDPNAVPAGLAAMLDQIIYADPSLKIDLEYLKLLGWARRRAAPV